MHTSCFWDNNALPHLFCSDLLQIQVVKKAEWEQLRAAVTVNTLTTVVPTNIAKKPDNQDSKHFLCGVIMFSDINRKSPSTWLDNCVSCWAEEQL